MNQERLKGIVPEDIAEVEDAIINVLAAKERYDERKQDYDAAKERLIKAMHDTNQNIYESKHFFATLENTDKVTIKVRKDQD